MGNSPPVFVKQYPILDRVKPVVQERIGEWISKGWVVKSLKGNPWSFLLMAAKKKDGMGRMTAVHVA